MKNFSKPDLLLEDGSSVAVMGGGPAGSFFAYFLLLFAERAGLDLQVDIYEPRDFWVIGPGGCNMCGGIISESLIQSLAMEGISLPGGVVQRGIDSYVMHTEVGTSRIETPTQEKRIAAVHRGGGPRTSREGKWESFDAQLMKLAIAKGARFFNARVSGLQWNDGRPEVRVGNLPPQTYDLLTGAIGVNSSEVKLFENLGFRYERPRVVKTFITELGFGAEKVKELFGNSMHVFLLNLPRVDFAALIPKGDFVTLCMLGKDVNKNVIASFFEHPEVRACFPPGWESPKDTCHCSPKMHFGEAQRPFTDRVVLVGDCGTSRLYKDGIGAAFRTARAAARAAVFQGVSARAFHNGYLPEYRRISTDNLFGKAIFSAVHLAKYANFTLKAVLGVIDKEKGRPGPSRRMCGVLWDVFTGSSSYRDILWRVLHPMFIFSFCASLARNMFQPARAVPSRKAAAKHA